MLMRDKKVIVLENSPFNAETSMKTLSKAQTPTSEVYVRNHFDVPQVDENNWNLRIEGDVEKNIDISLEDLKKFPIKNVYVTMECAGNGRIFMSPVPTETPWKFGGVSFVNFKGPHSITYWILLKLSLKELKPYSLELIKERLNQVE